MRRLNRKTRWVVSGRAAAETEYLRSVLVGRLSDRMLDEFVFGYDGAPWPGGVFSNRLAITNCSSEPGPFFKPEDLRSELEDLMDITFPRPATLPLASRWGRGVFPFGRVNT